MDNEDDAATKLHAMLKRCDALQTKLNADLIAVNLSKEYFDLAKRRYEIALAHILQLVPNSFSKKIEKLCEDAEKAHRRAIKFSSN